MDVTTAALLSALFLVLAIGFYNRLLGPRDYWTSRGIPSVPGALPIVGNTLSVFRVKESFGTFCMKIYEDYRGRSMVGFYNMKQPALMLRDPDVIKTVLQTSFNNYQHNEALLDLEVDPLIGRDPFFIRDQAWRDSRALFVSTLSATRIKNVTSAITNVCKKLEDHLRDKIKHKDHLEVEAKFLFSRYTCEVAAAAVFGIEGNSFADDHKGTLLDSMKVTLDPTKIKALKHALLFFIPGLTKYLKISFVPPQVDKFFRNIVDNLESARLKDEAPKNDVLQHMLDLEKTGKVARIDSYAHAFSFFVESFETSSLLLSFASYLLAKHPRVQERLRTEVTTVLAKYEGRLSYEAINELVYMEQVMHETLRFYPSVAVLAKVCAEPHRLEAADGLTVDVEKDTTLLIPVAGLQKNPEYWENPEEFNPERFAKSNVELRHKYVFLPFGSGPRACPGQRLGIIQSKAAMATVVKNYRLELSPKMIDPVRIDPSYFLQTALGGFWINLRALKSQ